MIGPHLKAALTYTSVTGNTCVQRAAALMLDLPGATMVFGVMRAASAEEMGKDPRASPVPFIHAWVEYRGILLAPTTIERTGGELRAMPLDDYYRINGITKTWRLGPAAFLMVARRWKLSSAFKHNSSRAGRAEVADALLKAAGVRYRLSDRRTLLPVDPT
jgi:hypothetical protein